jgi:hypothetical protein
MDQASYYAKVAQLAYRSPTNFKDDDLDVLEGAIPLFVDINDCQCIVFRRATELVVAFRGSDSTRDLYRVLRAHLRPLVIGGIDCGRVHAGFHEYYRVLRGAVDAYIRTYLEAVGSRIVFVGHSLGACCVIPALEYTLLRPDISVACYTYGSPRIGDTAFSAIVYRRMRDNYFRISMQQDLVTRMPSASCGCCCFVHPPGGHSIGSPWSLRCFLLEIIAFLLLSQCLRDRILESHDIDCYIDALKERPPR